MGLTDRRSLRLEIGWCQSHSPFPLLEVGRERRLVDTQFYKEWSARPLCVFIALHVPDDINDSYKCTKAERDNQDYLLLSR
jgi:hypothetical protein